MGFENMAFQKFLFYIEENDCTCNLEIMPYREVIFLFYVENPLAMDFFDGL